MIKTTLRIDGMMCGMCEAHIKEMIRKSVPDAKKVTASHTRGEASFLTETEIDRVRLREAVSATGYTCLSVTAEPYEKKRWFGRK